MNVSLAASHCDDWTMWTDETSGMYRWYVSIAEDGTSPRAHLAMKFYIVQHKFSSS